MSYQDRVRVVVVSTTSESPHSFVLGTCKIFLPAAENIHGLESSDDLELRGSSAVHARILPQPSVSQASQAGL